MIRHPLAATLALALCGATLAGCVERKMIIRSSPPGARVLLDDIALDDPTPVEVPFDWGGTRRVTLMAPGYAVLEAEAALADPWTAWFPIDVFTELLYPGTLYDVQEFDYELRPLDPTFPTGDADMAVLRERQARLFERAEAYRAAGSDGPDAATASSPERRPSPAVDAVPLPPPTTTAPPPPLRRRDDPPPPPPLRRR